MSEYGNEEESREKSIARDVANDVKKTAEKTTKNMIKKAMKNLIVNVIRSKFVLIFGIIFIIIILLVSFLYVINGDSFGVGAKGADSFTSSIEFSKGNVLIDKGNLIEGALRQKGYTDEQISNMSDEMKKVNLGLGNLDIENLSSYDLIWKLNKDTFSQYLSNKEELAKLLNVELITQIVDTRKNPDEKINWDDIDFTSDKIQGIVKIKRQTGNSVKTLIYKDKTEFENLINNNNYDALNYFTLDNDNNMIVATYETTTYKLTTNDSLDLKDKSKVNFNKFDIQDYNNFDFGNYLNNKQLYTKTEKKLSQTKFNYQELIPDKYKMPFSYLWGLIIYSGDKEFAFKVADLVRESEIEITISDNIAITDTKNEYKYKKARRTDTFAQINIRYNENNTYELVNGDEIKNINRNFSKLWKGPIGLLVEDKFKEYTSDYLVSEQNYEYSNIEYTTTYHVNKEIDTISYNLTKANTWLFDYENNYTYSTDVNENNESSDETDWKFINYDSNNIDSTGRAQEFLEDTIKNYEQLVRERQQKELQQKIDNETKEISEKRTKLDDLTKQRENLDKKSSNYKRDYDKLTEQINKLKDELEKAQKEYDDFNNNTVKAFNSNTIQYLTGNVDKVENIFYVRNGSINKNTFNKVTNNKYVQGTPKTTLKVEESDERDNFIKIMKNYRDASNSLLELSDWLFESMESDEKTADMVDLTKYLFNIYSGTTRFGNISEDSILDWIEKSSFLNVNGSSMQEFIKKYVETWEGTSGESSDGKRYIVRDDGYGNLAVGRGVDIYNSGYLEQLKMACGGEIKSGTEIDKEIVDAIEFEILEEKSDKIKSMIQGLNLTDYQLAAIISRSYNCGDVGAVAVKRGNPALNFVDSYNRYWKDSDDLYEKEKTEGNFDHNLYKQYMSMPVTSNGQYSLGLERRRKSEWTLFQTGYGDVINERYNDKGGSSSIIEIADRIDRYMAQNSYSYSLNVNMLATTFEKSKPYKATCCATFVSWVLQEAGYIDEASHVNNVSGICRVLENVGWQKITSFEDLQPGDVMIQANSEDRTYGHTQIFAGKSTNGNVDIYSAGYDGEVKAIGPSTVSESVQKSKFNWGYRPK